MGMEVHVHDMNLLAQLHIGKAIPQSPQLREVMFSVEEVAGSLFRISEAKDYGLVFGQPEETNKLAYTAKTLERPGETLISSDALATWLSPLEKQLSSFSLMGFFLSRTELGYMKLYEQFQKAQLVPRLCVFATKETLEWDLTNPTPPVLVASRELDAWPGIAFWSPSGHCAFIPISALPGFLKEMREIGDAAGDQPQEALRLFDLALQTRSSLQPSPRLLHLSDLHFGTKESTNHQVLLLNHLDGVVKKVGRVIITGDLMEAPSPNNLVEFKAFLSRITSISMSDPIVIPGNHDERASYGSFVQRLEQVVRLDRNAVTVDHRLRCIFLGFDSSLDAIGPTGFVSEEQSRAVADQLELEISRLSSVEGFFRVALVHHHPLPWKEEREGLFKYLWKCIEEKALGMKDGDRFLRWCARREALLVLHGHKHRPRCRDERVDISPGKERQVMVVGCGTSLGVRYQPLGYNLITWNVAGRAWSVTFVEGESDGSGFFELESSLRYAQRAE